MDYKIKYANVDSRLIENTIHPADHELQQKQTWFGRLERSILLDGFRNPVVLTAKDGKLVPRYGGSRTMIAQKHNLAVPAIIADFDNMFPNAREIAFEDIERYFVDKPKSIIWKIHGLNISGCFDCHLFD